MTARDNEPDVEEAASYAFAQVSGAVVGGILLCAVISAVLQLFFGVGMTLGGATFVTLFCIPLAWGIRALIIRARGR
jgi:hypothetical protein